MKFLMPIDRSVVDRAASPNQVEGRIRTQHRVAGRAPPDRPRPTPDYGVYSEKSLSQLASVLAEST
jgi:hypothetical protein